MICMISSDCGGYEENMGFRLWSRLENGGVVRDVGKSVFCAGV